MSRWGENTGRAGKRTCKSLYFPLRRQNMTVIAHSVVMSMRYGVIQFCRSFSPPAGTGRGMSRSDRGMGWGFAGWNATSRKKRSLETCENIWERCSKTKDFHYRVIYVTSCINLFGANVADILLQIVIDRLRSERPHCAKHIFVLPRNRERCGQPPFGLLSV